MERQGLLTEPTRRRLLSLEVIDMIPRTISARGSEVIFREEGATVFSPTTALCGRVALAYSSSFSPDLAHETTTPSTRS